MTQPIDDGGTAFPVLFVSGGMTLRDWFAGMAMQGMLAEDASNYKFAELAEGSYEAADAMLAARKEARDE
jgi:hypothetical protein